MVATGIFLHTLFGMNGNTLTAYGHTREIVLGNVIAVILNLVLNILLIPRMGILGAGVASMFSYFIFNLYSSARLYLLEGIFPVTKQYIIPLVLTSLVITPIEYFLNSLTSGISELVLSGIVITLIFLTSTYQFGLSTTDRSMAKKLIGGREQSSADS